MIVVAVASGTSVDALDLAVVELSWSNDDTVALHVLGTGERPWPDRLAGRLLALLPPASSTAAELAALDTAVGQAVAAAAVEAIRTLAGGSADLVVSPGQTVHHEVVGGRCLGTLQIGQPAWVAEATGLPVVSDLRTRDVAAGGHGAPLVSTLDARWLARNDGLTRAALNLGGIANVTLVGPVDVLAWDTGPGCCLLDLAAQRVVGDRYDAGGALALAGKTRADLLDRLLSADYFALPPPKSTGREMFSAAYLDAALTGVNPVDGPDLLATLTQLTARTVAAGLPAEVSEVVVSGGGVHNPALIKALDRCLGGRTLTPSTAYGLDPDAKEVVLWALLGFLSWHGAPGTVPGGTAGRPRVLGQITPGRSPLVLPVPRPAGMRRLQVANDAAGVAR